MATNLTKLMADTTDLGSSENTKHNKYKKKKKSLHLRYIIFKLQKTKEKENLGRREKNTSPTEE